MISDRVVCVEPMAYDEDLVNRLRELLADREAVTEKQMFGGLAFLWHGRLTVAASRTGGLLTRVAPADTEACLKRDHTMRMTMGGRVREGWVLVAPEGVRTKRQAESWLKRSLAYVETLPPK
jgi:hypothetical protein